MNVRLIILAAVCSVLGMQAYAQNGPSYVETVGRIGAKDIDTVKALGLWGKPVELVNEVRGFGAILPKGTVGTVGVGEYAYAMSGAFSYDVEIPVTDLEPHGVGKTLGIRYENLRLIVSS